MSKEREPKRTDEETEKPADAPEGDSKGQAPAPDWLLDEIERRKEDEEKQ